MLPIIGIVVVFAAVITGFLMEKGHLLVLLQPSELVTIAGAAIGTLLVANPIHIIKAMIAGAIGALSPSRFSKARYLDTLKMLFELCNKVRKKGLIGIEDDVEKPAESEIFKKYPAFLERSPCEGVSVCDTLRTAITGGVEPFDMDQMMERDMEVAHHETLLPVNALTTVAARALPRTGYRCCGPRSSHHDGVTGRTAGRDWQESRCCFGWYFPWNSFVLRRGSGPLRRPI